MNTASDILQSQYYRVNRILLSWLGQWPFQRDRDKRIAFTIVSFITITQTLTKILALVTLRDNLEAIIECVPPLIADFMCFVKLANLIYNMEKIKQLFLHMQRDWHSWSIKSEFEILHKFAKSGRNITISYAGGMYGFGSLFSLIAMLPKIIGITVKSKYSTRPIGLPYHVEYYVDLEKYFYFALFHSYLSTAVRITIVVAADMCMAILVQHCCGLFSVARYRLEHIQTSIEQDKKLVSLEDDKKSYKNFVYCIEKHEDALQFASCLETIYVKIIFLEMGLIVGLISSSALQATNNTLTVELAIRHTGYMMTHILHLYIACWLGQQILDHSNYVYTSTYKGDWYKTSCKSRRLLNMIMLRSSSPCTLTIGKMMILSLATFSAVIRVSASYFTVLQSVK